MSKNTTELRPIPIIHGLDCPACGHSSLMLGDGGYVTCAIEECPNPDYAEALEELISNREKLLLDRVEDEAVTFAVPKTYKVVTDELGTTGDAEGMEYIQAVPVQKLSTLRKELDGDSDE